MKKINKLFTLLIILLIINIFNILKTKAQEDVQTYGPYDEIENIEMTNNGPSYTYITNNENYYQINDQVFKATDYCMLNADGCYSTSQFKSSDNNWMFVDMDGELFADGTVFTVKTKNEDYGPYEYVLPNFYVTDNNIGFIYLEKNKEYTGENMIIKINDSEYKVKEYLLNDIISGFKVKENIWAFRYKKSYEGEEYIKINGQEYGPYERINTFDISDNNWGFVYTESGECFVNVNGDIFGPNETNEYGFCSFDLSISDKHWAVKYRQDNKYYINVDNSTYGPYDNIIYEPFVFIDNNNWGFKFMRDDEYYINANGTEYETTRYQDLKPNNFLDDNWGFVYTEGEDKYAIINNKTYGPYEVINLELSNKNFAFIYLENEKVYVNINGEIQGEYYNSDLSLSNEHVSFTHKNENQYWYTIDGQEYGPFDKNHQISILDNHILIFIYDEETNKYIITIDGQEYGPFDFEFFDDNHNFYYSGNKWAFKYKKDDEWYILTNVDNIISNPEITLTSTSIQIDTTLSNNLKGKLLLAVEDHGRIWYVNPDDAKKYEVTFANALNLFKKLSLGITNTDLNKISLSTDNWNSNSGNRLKGKLLLAVEDHGRIWYVDMNGKRHEVTWNNLMDLFTSLSLGITNENLAKIENETIMTDTDNDGLIDSDEAIYGTDINNPDSDGDGYLDGEEVEHGYDPLQGGGAKL